jgi:hypothetical protein
MPTLSDGTSAYGKPLRSGAACRETSKRAGEERHEGIKVLAEKKSRAQLEDIQARVKLISKSLEDLVFDGLRTANSYKAKLDEIDLRIKELGDQKPGKLERDIQWYRHAGKLGWKVKGSLADFIEDLIEFYEDHK